MSTKRPLRRLLIASMPAGEIGLGFVGDNAAFSIDMILRAGLPLSDCALSLPRAKNPECIKARLTAFHGDEV